MWLGHLELELYFHHKFIVFALYSLSQTDSQVPNGLDSRSMFLSLPWTFPLYSQHHVTPNSWIPKCLLFFFWFFGLSCQTCFLSAASCFSLTNLLTLNAWKGKQKNISVLTPRSQSLTVAPIQPHNSPKPIDSIIRYPMHYTNIIWFLVQNTGRWN